MGEVPTSVLAGQKQAGSVREQGARKQAQSMSEKAPKLAGKNQVEGLDWSSVVKDDVDNLAGQVLVSESLDGED